MKNTSIHSSNPKYVNINCRRYLDLAHFNLPVHYLMISESTLNSLYSEKEDFCEDVLSK